MPTILRFHGFIIVMYPGDHRPSHVHAIGAGVEAIFNLNCWTGPITLRNRFGTSQQQEKAISKFLQDNLQSLCQRWEKMHGDPTAT